MRVDASGCEGRAGAIDLDLGPGALDADVALEPRAPVPSKTRARLRSKSNRLFPVTKATSAFRFIRSDREREDLTPRWRDVLPDAMEMLETIGAERARVPGVPAGNEESRGAGDPVPELLQLVVYRREHVDDASHRCESAGRRRVRPHLRQEEGS